MRTARWQGRTVCLRPVDLLATGGEGTLWAVGGAVYKVWHDADGVPCQTRLSELRASSHPGMVLPDGHLLDDDGRPIGVRMPLVQGSPLVRLTSAISGQGKGSRTTTSFGWSTDYAPISAPSTARA